jgi:hypothetical protein
MTEERLEHYRVHPPDPPKAVNQIDVTNLNSTGRPEPKINSLNTRIISAGKPVPNGSKHPVAPPTRLAVDKRPLFRAGAGRGK